MGTRRSSGRIQIRKHQDEKLFELEQDQSNERPRPLTAAKPFTRSSVSVSDRSRSRVSRLSVGYSTLVDKPLAPPSQPVRLRAPRRTKSSDERGEMHKPLGEASLAGKENLHEKAKRKHGRITHDSSNSQKSPKRRKFSPQNLMSQTSKGSVACKAAYGGVIPNEFSIISRESTSAKSFWDSINKLSFLDVATVHVGEADAKSKTDLYRLGGIPCVIKGHAGWASFSYKWLRPHAFHEPVVTLEGGEFDLDVEALVKDIGEESVPVVLPDYNERQPIKQVVKCKTFIHEAWLQKKRRWYLHQWQFPLSASARKKLCYQNAALPVLGYNLLQLWLETLIGDCPYQYIFMGAKETVSRLHQDKGGLAILLAPITGEKEMILVHRDDAARLYYGRANIDAPDFHTQPLSSFIRAWKVILKPGDILCMPSNTFHAAKNITDCLSYSRFHLDELNLGMFVNSYLEKDDVTPHEQMTWNVCVELMKVLDAEYDAAQLHRRTDEPENPQKKNTSVRNCSTNEECRAKSTGNGLNTGASRSSQAQCYADGLGLYPRHEEAFAQLTKLRHAVRAIMQAREQSDGLLEQFSAISDDDWDKLLGDVDGTLHDYCTRHEEPSDPVRPFDPKPKKPKAVKASKKRSHISVKPSLSQVSAKQKAPWRPSEEERALARSLKAGVKVLCPSHNKKEYKATVVGKSNVKAVLVHYLGWDSRYDDWKALTSIRDLDERSLQTWDDVCVGQTVRVQWNKEMYSAIVCGLYFGPLIHVSYDRLGKGWDRLLRPEQIKKVL